MRQVQIGESSIGLSVSSLFAQTHNRQQIFDIVLTLDLVQSWEMLSDLVQRWEMSTKIFVDT